MGSVICILSQILYAFQRCKNFENRLRFDKVTESSKVGTFLRHCVFSFSFMSNQINKHILSNNTILSYIVFFITARRSYASAVLEVVILFVRLSVCLSVRLSHACFVTNPKNLPAIFLYRGELNTRGVAKYSDFGLIEGYISETMQDRR